MHLEMDGPAINVQEYLLRDASLSSVLNRGIVLHKTKIRLISKFLEAMEHAVLEQDKSTRSSTAPHDFL